MPNRASIDGTSLKVVPYRTPSRSGTSSNSKKRRRVTDGGARTSAAKIRVACTKCRERKTRCSGHVPCQRCQEQGQVCQYMPMASSRTGESGSANGALSPSNTSMSVASRPTHQFSTIRDAGNPWLGQDVPTATTGNDKDTPDETLQQDHYGHFHGSASEFAFLHFAKQKLANLPSISVHFHDYPLAGSGKYTPVLPPKETADHLISSFFDFGLSTSRFVHRKALVASYERLYHGALDESLGSDDAALVYMVMALGAHYSNSSDAFCGYSASIRFFDMASTQLNSQHRQSAMSSLQARLLVVHYLLNHSRMHEAWSSYGTIVRDAQALGLHRRSPGPLGNYITYEYRRRLFWAIYINDRILSSIFGRPCAIHDDDIDQEECSLANDHDISRESIRLAADGDFCQSAAFIRYARISRILGKILRVLYSPARRLHGMSRLREEATVLEAALIDWQRSLPPYLNYVTLPASAMSTMTQRQMCTLKLTFAHTCLLLYRPFIVYSIETASQRPPRLDQWIRHCHEKSIEAAKTVVSECRSLHERGMFSRVFWLVNYVQFAAVGTLFMYSHLWPDASNARYIAEEAMAEFPVGVDGDLVGQRYLQVLQELREITAQSQSSTGPATGNSQDPEDEGSMFDAELVELGGPWSNLFFDTMTMDGDFGQGG